MTLVGRRARSALLILAGLLVSLTAPLPAASQVGSPPTVEFITAPAPGATVPYRVSFAWQGDDADGSVVLYRVAIDPPAFGEPFWLETPNTAATYFFVTSVLDSPIPPTGPITFKQPHTVMLKAVDNDGLESDPVSRSFITSNVAPAVQILSPTPSQNFPVSIGTSVTIAWQGTDTDGVFTNRPVRYKYHLMGPFDAFPGGVSAAWTNPDAFRQWYAPTFAGWDSTSGDTTSVQFTNLIPGVNYLFTVVGIDEAGAYSARFGRAVNMIQLLPAATPATTTSWGSLKRRYR